MFADELRVDLHVEAGDVKVDIPAGGVKAFAVELHSYGFIADVEFWVSLRVEEDKLRAAFVTNERIDARLTAIAARDLPRPAPDPLRVAGLVTERSFSEVTDEGVEGRPVLLRRYRIRFADPAAVLWRQHFPSLLYSEEATLGKVVDGAVVQGINLERTWPLLDEVHPIVCLALGHERNEASFYDFVVWLCDRHLGVLSYDAKTNRYGLAAEKPAAAGPALELRSTEVAEVEALFPPLVRHSARVLNALRKDATTVALASKLAVAGIRRDVMLVAPVAKHAEARKKVEEKRLAPPVHELRIRFQAFPKVTLRPLCLVKLNARHGGFSAASEHRVRTVSVVAHAVEQDPDLSRGEVDARFHLSVETTLEGKAEPRAHLPPFKAPETTVYVEGTVVSELGKDGDKTYEIVKDATTSIEHYRVQVPVWNKVIPVPFDPGALPGHLYFPLFRAAPVLLRLDLHSARIQRSLDWGAQTRLPADGLGDHILFGKRWTSQTSLSHIHKDHKPVLELKRLLSADEKKGDTQVIRLEEGMITLLAQEEEVTAPKDVKVSVKPEVEAARAGLVAENEGAMSELTSTYGLVQSGLGAALGAATAEVEAALEDMDSEIKGKVGAARAEVQAALGQMQDATARLKAAQAEAEAALRAEGG